MNIAELFYPIVPHLSLSWTLNFHKSSCESFSVTAFDGMCKLSVSDTGRHVYVAESHWLPFSTNTHC